MPTVTKTVSVVGHKPLVTVTIYEVVTVGQTIGLGVFVLLIFVLGVQERVVPIGPVGVPPICTLSPKHTFLSIPASEIGAAKMVIPVSIELEGHPQVLLVAITETVPAPAAPQVTVIEEEPCPVLIVPPVAVQLKV